MRGDSLGRISGTVYCGQLPHSYKVQNYLCDSKLRRPFRHWRSGYFQLEEGEGARRGKRHNCFEGSGYLMHRTHSYGFWPSRLVERGDQGSVGVLLLITPLSLNQLNAFSTLLPLSQQCSHCVPLNSTHIKKRGIPQTPPPIYHH